MKCSIAMKVVWHVSTNQWKSLHQKKNDVSRQWQVANVVNIYVYRLVEVYDEDKHKTEIVAQLIQRSHRSYANTMYLNLYGSHFSYIKNLKMYSKSYCCCKCDKMWKTAKALNKHERTCEAAVQYVTFSLVVPTKFHKPSSICSTTKVSTFLKYFP